MKSLTLFCFIGLLFFAAACKKEIIKETQLSNNTDKLPIDTTDTTAGSEI